MLQIGDAEQAEAALKGKIDSAQIAYEYMANGLRGNVANFAVGDDGSTTWNGRTFDVPDPKQVAADVQELKRLRTLLTELRKQEKQS